MYIQQRINKAFVIFCQDPSTENRNALVTDCKDLIEVALSLTPGMEEKEDDIEQEIERLFIEFLDRHKEFEQVRNPAAFLYKFVLRNALNCLKARWPSKLCSKCKGTGLVEGTTCQVCLGKGKVLLHPDQLPVVEKKGWTRPEPEATKPKGDPAMELKRKKSKYYLEQGGHYGPDPDKRTKEFQFYQKLFRENRKDFLESTDTNKDQFAPTKDWELDRKKIPERGRISSLIRIKPYLRKARFSKKTR